MNTGVIYIGVMILVFYYGIGLIRSAIYGEQKPSMTTSRLVGIIVIILTVSVILAPLHDKKKSSTKTNHSWQNIAIWPQEEEAFISLVEGFMPEFKAAKNELQESVLKTKRIQALKALNILSFDDWFGVLDTLGTTKSGDAYVAIKIRGIRLQTWNNSFSDIRDNTLIKQESQLYQKLLNLQKGDAVMFSGSFVLDKDTFIREGSLTINGEMLNPEFIVNFTEIKKAPVCYDSRNILMDIAFDNGRIAKYQQNICITGTIYYDRKDMYVLMYSAANNDINKTYAIAILKNKNMPTYKEGEIVSFFNLKFDDYVAIKDYSTTTFLLFSEGK